MLAVIPDPSQKSESKAIPQFHTVVVLCVHQELPSSSVSNAVDSERHRGEEAVRHFARDAKARVFIFDILATVLRLVVLPT